ncbi:MAG: bifunctional lysylphosphatidylglycerol synthetase/lysine--tRNA ligase LysX [Actinomycetaceae bacterium]|nr:bifunctional lysylphosphatidylglycerol synthetase/lysine--tRNA ligase LysX [Actinomycetaceae bacterium]
MSETLSVVREDSDLSDQLKMFHGWRARVIRSLARFIYFGALLSVLLTIGGGHFHTALRVISLAFFLVNLPVGATLVESLFLVVFGFAIMTRKRIAWWVFLFLQGIGLFFGITSLSALMQIPDRSTGWAIAFAIIKCVTAVGLGLGALSMRRAFPGRVLPGSLFGAAFILLVGFGATIAIGMTVVDIARPGPITDESTRWVLASTLGDYFSTLIYVEPPRNVPLWIRYPLGLLSALTTVAAVLFFMRGQRMPGRRMHDDLFARELLARWGDDSLGYFATRNDRSIVRSQDGLAAISYGVANGVAIAGGDPLGDPQSWSKAISQWLALCATYGWMPGAISVSQKGAEAYREAGFSVRLMGDEAIIDTRTFDLNTPTAKPLAAAVRRVRRHHIDISIARLSDIDADELNELRAAAHQFRRGEERGFSMSLDRILEDVDARTLIVWARDEAGTLQAMLSFIPWGRHGISLSLMRRNPQSVNGIIEAMVVELIRESAASGIDRISLNFAMFRRIFEQGEAVDASAWDRIVYAMMRVASRVWQLESLYESNARYSPLWVARYMCFPGITELSQISLAAASLEGFLPQFGHRTQLEWKPTPDYLKAIDDIDRAAILAAMPQRRLSDQEQVRRDKAQRLQAAGMDPYPPSVSLGTSPARIIADYGTTHASQRTGTTIESGGRITGYRDHGGVIFIDLARDNHSIQVVADRSHLAEELFELLSLCDLGDSIAVSGEVIRTRRGELSIDITDWHMAAKSLRPVVKPGVDLDATTRARERVTHLLATPTAIELLNLRARGVAQIRQVMADEGFVEVETPMLHAIHGGANARPFVTHMNAYSTDVFLRIAPELYLKRLAVAGMGAIYEMGRSFRNEGADATHNPEFTSIEAYRAGGDYTTMRELTEHLIKSMARAMHGSEIALRPAGSPGVENAAPVTTLDGVSLAAYSLAGQWPVVRVYDAISSALEHTITTQTPAEELAALARSHAVELPHTLDHANLIGALYDDLVEARTVHPTFYTDFPAATSPLTRQHRHNPLLAERWDLVAFGMELGTAYTELTDPRDQRDRFTAQSLAAAAGDPEAMSIDEQFLSDLELGLVPTGGLGLGVDRLCMLLTGVNIRQLLAFPYVKPVSEPRGT